jgi:Flp pilus assembly protein TadG
MVRAAIACVWRGRDGNAAVEFALVLPVFIVLIVGMIEVGRILWTQNTLQQAVEAAARCGSISASTCGSSSAVRQFAAAQTAGLGVPASDFTATTSSCGSQVNATVQYQYLTSFLPMPALSLTAEACFPK